MLFVLMLYVISRCNTSTANPLLYWQVATHSLEFRASNAREANKWIKGINSVVSRFGFVSVPATAGGGADSIRAKATEAEGTLGFVHSFGLLTMG